MVAGLHTSVDGCQLLEADKAEAARVTGYLVFHDEHPGHLTVLLKVLFQLLLSGLIVQPSHEKFLGLIFFLVLMCLSRWLRSSRFLRRLISCVYCRPHLFYGSHRGVIGRVFTLLRCWGLCWFRFLLQLLQVILRIFRKDIADYVALSLDSHGEARSAGR
eukprot:scaffold1377_cov390-Prasinococcus_capsulatus_cf.AAC.10